MRLRLARKFLGAIIVIHTCMEVFERRGVGLPNYISIPIEIGSILAVWITVEKTSKSNPDGHPAGAPWSGDVK